MTAPAGGEAMILSTPSSPHDRGPSSVTRVMLEVAFALLPGIAVYAWFFGWPLLIQIALAVVTAMLAEALMLALRRRAVLPALGDGSALLTAVLLALALPPGLPWWVTASGAAFAIVVAKQLYGGLGYNPFNPAMAGYVMVLISFPVHVTAWPAPLGPGGVGLGLEDSAALVFTLGGTSAVDGLTGATPLDFLRTGLGMGRDVASLLAEPLYGLLGGRSFEWIALGYLAGGLWLLWRRVIAWHIPVAMLAGLALPSLVFFALDPASHASPLFHLASGGAMLGAFFIATDPVSAATTPRGRLLFGAGVGLITFLIRGFGGYPEGIAFAVLLMNMAVPTIDHYTRPRIYGERH